MRILTNSNQNFIRTNILFKNKLTGSCFSVYKQKRYTSSPLFKERFIFVKAVKTNLYLKQPSFIDPPLLKHSGVTFLYLLYTLLRFVSLLRNWQHGTSPLSVLVEPTSQKLKQRKHYSWNVVEYWVILSTLLFIAGIKRRAQPTFLRTQTQSTLKSSTLLFGIYKNSHTESVQENPL